MSPSFLRRLWMACSSMYLMGMTSSALQAISTFRASSSPARYFFHRRGALVPLTSLRIGWVILSSSLIFFSPPFHPNSLIMSIRSKLIIPDQSTPNSLPIYGKSNLFPLKVTTALQLRMSSLNSSRLKPLMQYLIEQPSKRTIEVILNLSPIICLKPVVSMSRQAISSIESASRSLLGRCSEKYLQSFEQQRYCISRICSHNCSLFLLTSEAEGRLESRARKVFIPSLHSYAQGNPRREKLARVMLSKRQVVSFGLNKSGFLVRKDGRIFLVVYSGFCYWMLSFSN